MNSFDDTPPRNSLAFKKVVDKSYRTVFRTRPAAIEGSRVMEYHSPAWHYESIPVYPVTANSRLSMISVDE